MSTPEQPEQVPNPYAERQLDDDSAGALAALLFDSPVQQAADDSITPTKAANGHAPEQGRTPEQGHAGEPGPDQGQDSDPAQGHPGDAIGATALSQQVSPSSEIDRSVVEATGTLFAPLDEAGFDDLDDYQPPVGNRSLFADQAPADPGPPASLRWSNVAGEQTVAEMGSAPANDGRRLFLEDAGPTSVPPRLYPAPPDRYGTGQATFGELVERRWHWFAVAGVTGLLIGFVAFTVGGGSDGDQRFPSVSVQSGDDAAESVADTIPAGPALAANEDGNAGSFKGATTETTAAPAPATAPRRSAGGTTTETSTSSSTSSTVEGSTSSSSTLDSTTSTELSTTTTSTPSTTMRPTTTSTTMRTTTTADDTTTTTEDTTTT
ncbi:MAG: hypothetical protein AAFO29_18190, partial [Actinomycetota bacterium]